MSAYIMQLRDLFDGLSPHDPTCEVAATLTDDENCNEVPILEFRRCSRRRRILIVVEGDSKVPDLEAQIADRELLLESFDKHMLERYQFTDAQNLEKLKVLHKDVCALLGIECKEE